MNILSLENVSKNYGFKPLFENVTLGLEDRDKIGIIGANGSGKTTLLKMIAGLEQPDTGRVTRAKGKSLAYLSQNPPYDDKLTVLETIFASSSGYAVDPDYETSVRIAQAVRCRDASACPIFNTTEEGGCEGRDERTSGPENAISRHVRKRAHFPRSAQAVALAHVIFKPDILISRTDPPSRLGHIECSKILSRYTGFSCSSRTIDIFSTSHGPHLRDR